MSAMLNKGSEKIITTSDPNMCAIQAAEEQLRSLLNGVMDLYREAQPVRKVWESVDRITNLADEIKINASALRVRLEEEDMTYDQWTSQQTGFDGTVRQEIE